MKPRSKLRKRILLGVGAFLVLAFLFAGGFVWYTYHSVKQTATTMFEPTVRPVYASTDPEVKPKSAPVKLSAKEPFSVLLMGIDHRENDRGRSDTMIVLSVNPAKKSILMFNVPRDSRTEIVGHDTVDKINHAYAFGNIEMATQTVEQFLDFPINYNVTVDMEGFAKIIDTLGGVEVDNPTAFDFSGYSFKKGNLKLNGSEALEYSRMRHEDPRGDLGRNARQREIIQGIIHHALNISNITRMQKLLGEVGDSVRTNMNFSEMKSFVSKYRPELDKIQFVEIKGKGQTINGIWYYIVDDAERQRIHNLIKEHQQP